MAVPNRARPRGVVAAVARFEPDLILLLGWIGLLAGGVSGARFPETINVHPAFLALDPADDRVFMPDGSVIPALRGRPCAGRTRSPQARAGRARACMA